LPKQCPTLIMAPGRDAVIAKAYEWIELQLGSGKSPHDLQPDSTRARRL
jgi:hypothetical protein